jgi:hypothetical protein
MCWHCQREMDTDSRFHKAGSGGSKSKHTHRWGCTAAGCMPMLTHPPTSSGVLGAARCSGASSRRRSSGRTAGQLPGSAWAARAGALTPDHPHPTARRLMEEAAANGAAAAAAAGQPGADGAKGGPLPPRALPAPLRASSDAAAASGTAAGCPRPAPSPLLPPPPLTHTPTPPSPLLASAEGEGADGAKAGEGNPGSQPKRPSYPANEKGGGGGGAPSRSYRPAPGPAGPPRNGPPSLTYKGYPAGERLWAGRLWAAPARAKGRGWRRWQCQVAGLWPRGGDVPAQLWSRTPPQLLALLLASCSRATRHGACPPSCPPHYASPRPLPHPSPPARPAPCRRQAPARRAAHGPGCGSGGHRQEARPRADERAAAWHAGEQARVSRACARHARPGCAPQRDAEVVLRRPGVRVGGLGGSGAALRWGVGPAARSICLPLRPPACRASSWTWRSWPPTGSTWRPCPS